MCGEFGAAAGIRTRVVGLEGQWTRKRNVLDQARLRPQAVHENAFSANKGSRRRRKRLQRLSPSEFAVASIFKGRIQGPTSMPPRAVGFLLADLQAMKNRILYQSLALSLLASTEISANSARTRVSTGYVRLDEVLQGGFLAGSAVVLSTPLATRSQYF